MRRILLSTVTTLLLLGAASVLTSPAGATSLPQQPLQPAVGGHSLPCGQPVCYSLNWAGYVATGTVGTFSHVSASWSVPSLKCSSGENSYSAAWAGLDGWTSRTVEQTGTEADCSNGAPMFYAWYEIYPKLAVMCPFTVNAGDLISASVDYQGGEFTTSLSDGANQCGTSFVMQRAQRTSAEVIVEAPAGNHGPSGVLSLADFGTLSFSNAAVNGSSLGTYSPSATQSVMSTNGSSTGAVKASPESSQRGGSFSVMWEHA